MDGPLLVNLLDGGKSISPGFSKIGTKGNRHVFQAVFDDPYLESFDYLVRVLDYNGENRSGNTVL